MEWSYQNFAELFLSYLDEVLIPVNFDKTTEAPNIAV